MSKILFKKYHIKKTQKKEQREGEREKKLILTLVV